MFNREKHTKWMEFAYNEAVKAYKEDEVPIGAIVVLNNKIIGKGYNKVESLLDSTAHAEIISITSAANHLNDWRLKDCSIYITKEPCVMCYGAIINSRIKNIYYGFSDSENGFRSKISKEKILSCNHVENIESNILEYDCKKIIQDFFANKRKINKKS